VLTTRSNDRSGNASEATSPTRNDGRRSSPSPRTVGVGSGALDHGPIEVETGHLQAVLASQPDRQAAGPAPHLEHPCAVGGDRRDVGGDAAEERAEQQPAQRVVGDGIADEDSPRHPSPRGGTAAVPHDGDGRSGRAEQDHERSRSTHHSSSVYPGPGSLSSAESMEILVILAGLRPPR
jgi:hypothetical protein